MEYDPAAPYYHFTYEPAAAEGAAEEAGGGAAVDFGLSTGDQQLVFPDASFDFSGLSAGAGLLGDAFPVDEPWLPIEDASYGAQRPSLLGGISGSMPWDVIWPPEPPHTDETRPWQPYLPQTPLELPYTPSTAPMAAPYQSGSALYAGWQDFYTTMPPLPPPPVVVPSQRTLPALTIPPYYDDGPVTASSYSTDAERTPERDVESDPEYHATPTKRRRPSTRRKGTNGPKARSPAAKAPRRGRRRLSETQAESACFRCHDLHRKCERVPDATRCSACIKKNIQLCVFPLQSNRGKRPPRKL
ncbi:Zn(II)2Cys6 transcription factor [Phanerochaete sordida]|uniref:Zn(II)2Cys6 transcription factor n=1 Tax=Phanerochaete sordida TaxID=48140 RepID=A0A9P3G932_9APHY|nr:Zn(II)2Cys6 transcription factor [Phanerochaete sordida]